MTNAVRHTMHRQFVENDFTAGLKQMAIARNDRFRAWLRKEFMHVFSHDVRHGARLKNSSAARLIST